MSSQFVLIGMSAEFTDFWPKPLLQIDAGGTIDVVCTRDDSSHTLINDSRHATTERRYHCYWAF